jgi:hypothetical protein
MGSDRSPISFGAHSSPGRSRRNVACAALAAMGKRRVFLTITVPVTHGRPYRRALVAARARRFCGRLCGDAISTGHRPDPKDQALERIVCIMANVPMITRPDINGVQSGRLSLNVRQTEDGRTEAGSLTRSQPPAP